MNDQPSGELTGLKREWLLARLILALSVLSTFGLWLWLGLFSGGPVVSPDPQVQAAPEPDHSEDEAAAQGTRLCMAAVTSAKNFGVVPLSTHAVGPAGTSDTVGRYLCRISTGTEYYVIAVDLECRNLADDHCLSLFSVTRENGQVLFQRQS